MYRFVLLSLLNVFLLLQAYCQMTQAVRVTSENDNYIWPFHDRYFTNGLRLSYSQIQKKPWIVPRKQHQNSFHKTILHFQLAQEIYTPDNIKKSDLIEFDRPYAGYLYVQAKASTFWGRSSNLQLGIDVGIIGPWAGGYAVQRWWHQLIQYTQPRGWQYQINNEPVINLNLGYQKAWKVFSSTDVLTCSQLRAGTSFNSLSGGIKVRIGKLNPIDNSAIAESRVNTRFSLQQMAKDHHQEWFVFYGLDGMLVWHNTLIEGSLLSVFESLHIEKANPYVLTQNAGLVYSTLSTTIQLTLYALSPEVKGGKNHHYLRIDFVYRF